MGVQLVKALIARLETGAESFVSRPRPTIHNLVRQTANGTFKNIFHMSRGLLCIANFPLHYQVLKEE